MTRHAGIFFCGVVLGAASFLLFNDLGVAPLELYDEGTYAQVVAESIARGDFLTFTYQNQLFFDKPPLYFWLAGIATVLTNDPVLGIRLPAALAGIGVVAMVIVLAYYWSRNYFTAAFAGSILIAIPPFLVAAREARLDVLITLFILLALYAVLTRRWFMWGAIVALAVMAKSAIAVFAVLPALLYIRKKCFWQGALVTLSLIAPWHLYEWIRHGNDFWWSYLGYHVFERYATNVFYNPNLQTDYWARLNEQAPQVLGFSILMLVVAAALWREFRREEHRALMLPFGLGVSMIALFFSAQTRALSYLVPLYPMVALFVALSCSFAIQRLREKLWYELPSNDSRTS